MESITIGKITMERFNILLLQLREDPEYKLVLLGKDKYDNFIKRQEALGDILLDKYLRNFEESSFHKFGGKGNAISETERIFEMLNNCCKSFLSGDIATAINLMYNCYFRDGVLLKTVQLTSGSVFYRMRKAANYNLFKNEEMFHIPFEKNYLIKNERFSISGFPSFYLGKSVYVCWEEMGRPDFDQANVAVYMNREDSTIIDLCMPMQTEDTKSALFTLPMILCSSLPVLHPDSDFKPEYIIPQLLMQCLVRYNKESDKAIDGIRYDSIHKFDGESFYDYREKGMASIYENYVFPARQINDEGHCPVLSELFDLGCSDSFARYELEGYDSTKTKEESLGTKYEMSKFYAMERHLFKVAKDSMKQYDSRNPRGMLASKV